MNELEFKFQDVLSEIDALDKIVGPFCQPRSRAVLPQLRSDLESIRDTTTDRDWSWGIREDHAFVTKVSHGSYQADDQGEHNVFAAITSTWTIRRVRPPGKKAARAERFALTGNASTRVRLHREATADAPSRELAMWRAEVGDFQSPGCHFHVQILGESEEGPFPHSLDVPRLPGLLTTPPAVVEYVLGELFQETWIKHLASQGADLNRWIPIQRRRLGAVLLWQLGVIKEASGSPWTTLKKAKPHSDLFLLAELPA